MQKQSQLNGIGDLNWKLKPITATFDNSMHMDKQKMKKIITSEASIVLILQVNVLS